MKNAFYFIKNALLLLQVFKFWKFLSCPLWFQEEVGNGIIVTSRNGLHKLLIVIFAKPSKPL